MRVILFVALWGFITPVLCQDFDQQLQSLEAELNQLKAQEKTILLQIEEVKLGKISADLRKNGLPKVEAGEEVVYHSALALVYSEQHEQAKWVAHIISPDIVNGNVSRTNDFRPDPKVSTGSTVEEDYFLKFLQPDSTYKYDGYGYDRGHLAPSADL